MSRWGRLDHYKIKEDTTSENIKETLEFLNLNKDIKERQQLIQDYIVCGVLDRHKAIEKIRELQTTDIDITLATATVQIMRGAVILECADDNTLIENLQFQINILEGKLIDKIKNNNTGV